MAADFVAERGGGLLVVGGAIVRAARPGRHAARGRPAGGTGRAARRRSSATASRRRRPGGAQQGRSSRPKASVIPRCGSAIRQRRRAGSGRRCRRWPAARRSEVLGPAPTVLAVTSSAAGGVFPVVAVQRYGRGRSMVFAGEASWRWKMMLASSDRSYEFFWRQAARWIAGAAADPVTIAVPESAGAGDEVSIAVEVRDAAFAPVGDAAVDATLTVPGGAAARRSGCGARIGVAGQYAARVRVGRSRRLSSRRRRASRATRGSAARVRWLYVGGVDREFADPRLNEPWLRRVARASGGRYVRAGGGVANRWLAAGSDAAAGGARAPRSVARAVGVCGHRRAAVGGVDPAAAVGAAVRRMQSRMSRRGRRGRRAQCLRRAVGVRVGGPRCVAPAARQSPGSRSLCRRDHRRVGRQRVRGEIRHVADRAGRRC